MSKPQVYVCVFSKIPAGENVDPIPACLLRKYISYARQYVHPTLSPEAAQILQDFYLSLRSQSHTADSTPITTRQLESLIRLTEVGFFMSGVSYRISFLLSQSTLKSSTVLH